jgi:hypothetical protein
MPQQRVEQVSISWETQPLPPPIRPSDTLEDSPRGMAHAQMLEALAGHDAKALSSAIAMAKLVGVTGAGIEAAENALQVMQGWDQMGTDAMRNEALTKLLQTTSTGSVKEIRSAIQEAVQVGADTRYDLAVQSLNLRLDDRSRALDSLKVQMEEYVSGLEAGRTTSERMLDKLQKAWEQASELAESKDAEFLSTAERLVAFERSREKILGELEESVFRHAEAMEQIADLVEAKLMPERKTKTPSVRATEAARNRLRQPLMLPSKTASAKFIAPQGVPSARDDLASKAVRSSVSANTRPAVDVQTGGGVKSGAQLGAGTRGKTPPKFVLPKARGHSTPRAGVGVRFQAQLGSAVRSQTPPKATGHSFPS